MVRCGSTAAAHCCWLGGELGLCEHFDPTLPSGRQCKLRHQLGSWEAVYMDPRYRKVRLSPWHVRTGDDCGDYPQPGVTCGECGVTGA